MTRELPLISILGHPNIRSSTCRQIIGYGIRPEDDRLQTWRYQSHAMPSPTSLHVNTSGHSAKKHWRTGSKPPYPSVHNQITGMCSSLFIPSIPNGCRCSPIPMCCGRSKVFRSAPPDPHLVQSGVQQVLLEAHTSCLEWMP